MNKKKPKTKDNNDPDKQEKNPKLEKITLTSL